MLGFLPTKLLKCRCTCQAKVITYCSMRNLNQNDIQISSLYQLKHRRPSMTHKKSNFRTTGYAFDIDQPRSLLLYLSNMYRIKEIE